jgi:hypothetical protein
VKDLRDRTEELAVIQLVVCTQLRKEGDKKRVTCSGEEVLKEVCDFLTGKADE